MGGDEIFATLKAHLGIGNDERTTESQDERTVTLEHIECNAACDFAPVMTVNWEFFDNMTPTTAVELVDELPAGREVAPTRGPALVPVQRDRADPGRLRGRAGADDGARGPARPAPAEASRGAEESATGRRRDGSEDRRRPERVSRG